MRLVLPALIALILFSCNKIENQKPDNNNFERTQDKLYPYIGRYLERAYPEKEIDVDAFLVTKEKIHSDLEQAIRSPRFPEQWETQGPGNLGGRVTTIALHPTDKNVIYIGYSTGGAYKTVDGGESWAPIFDAYPTLSIGHIAIHPVDHETVYLGTGDPIISSLPHVGTGLYKSTDGGTSWEKSGLEEQRIISKVEIDPNNPDRIFASSLGLPFTYNNSRGIYLSEDAGASWEKAYEYSDSTGFTNVVINPGNTDIVYATGWDRVRSNQFNFLTGVGSAVFISEDGGQTWNKDIPGLPSGEQCKTGITVCENNPEIVYVVYIDRDRQLEGIYKSMDYGKSYERIEHDLDEDVMRSFGWYFGRISVNPNDPDHLFLHSVDLHESRDGGETWNLAAPPWWAYSVHADHHVVEFSEDGFVFIGTDGGAYKRVVDGDENDWKDIEDIPTNMFYRVAYNPHLPQYVYGGAQDNGTTAGNSSVENWPRLLGGDGFQAVFNPVNPDHYFFEIQNGEIRITRDGSNFEEATDGIDEGRKAWDMQYIMSPHSEWVMYTGTDRIYKCENSFLPEWESISGVLTKDVLVGNREPSMTSISESPIDEGVIYACFNEGSVHVTVDGGTEWNAIITGLPNRYATSIKASPDYPSWAYITFSGYKDNDNSAYVFKTENYGESWTSINADLPGIAINDIFIMPNMDDQLLFIATDVGVYGSTDGAESWSRVGDNMPMVITNDLEYNPQTRELIAATFGKSIMTYSLESLLGPASNSRLTSRTISVSPSPTSDFISITTEDFGAKVSYQIISAEGQVLETKEAISKDSRIDVTRLVSGVYYLRVSDSKETSTATFVKS